MHTKIVGFTCNLHENQHNLSITQINLDYAKTSIVINKHKSTALCSSINIKPYLTWSQHLLKAQHYHLVFAIGPHLKYRGSLSTTISLHPSLIGSRAFIASKTINAKVGYLSSHVRWIGQLFLHFYLPRTY